MIRGIYGYIDKKINKIVYIGQDSYIDYDSRHIQHFQSHRYTQQPINKILQNNPNRYEYIVLERGKFSDKELDDLEIKYIDFYGTFRLKTGFGWNFTRGGKGKQTYFIEEKEIINLYQNTDLNMREIGSKLHISSDIVSNILKKNGIKRKKRKEHSVRQHEEKICQMYKDGESAYDISIFLDCSLSFIYTVLKENNIKLYLDNKYFLNTNGSRYWINDKNRKILISTSTVSYDKIIYFLNLLNNNEEQALKEIKEAKKFLFKIIKMGKTKNKKQRYAVPDKNGKTLINSTDYNFLVFVCDKLNNDNTILNNWKENLNKIKKEYGYNKNKSGYYRVYIKKNKECKQGFCYEYTYTINNKKKYISSVDLNILEQKVKEKGLEWREL